MSLLDALLRGGTTASRLATSSAGVTVRVDSADPPNDSGGQVLMTVPGGLAASWVTPSEDGGPVVPVQRNTLLDPPTAGAHVDDDEFASGSPDLGQRGWTVMALGGSDQQTMHRVGDVLPPGVGALFSDNKEYRSSIIGGRFYIQLPAYNAYPGNNPGVRIFKPLTGPLTGTGAVYASAGIVHVDNPSTGHLWLFCARANNGRPESYVRLEWNGFFDDSNTSKSTGGDGDVLVLQHNNNKWYPHTVQSWSRRSFTPNNWSASNDHKPADMIYGGIAIGYQDQRPQQWYELRFFRRIADANTWVYRP